jgi:hypothetical protein
MTTTTRISQDLTVTFHREGRSPEEIVASDGERAWTHAIGLLAKYDALQHGDTLTIRWTEGEEPEDDMDVEIVRTPHEGTP